MSKRKNIKIKKIIVSLLIILALSIISAVKDTKDITDFSEKSNNEAYVHFIDVGQGSATLVSCGSNGILIDSGEADYSDILTDYINSCGITQLEYVIASHPHSDHIGGIPDILEAFPVGTFIMPELTESNIPTTRVYEKMLETLDDKNINCVYSEVNTIYNLCDGIAFQILGPCEQNDDLNNMSVIVKLSVNGTDFMVLGDAEKQELSSVLNAYPDTDYSADVLCVGHHGSSTSVHIGFLDCVNADVAVISCGRDNSYGHPHKEALEYISDRDMLLYRTDLQGDIIFKCSKYGYERIENK